MSNFTPLEAQRVFDQNHRGKRILLAEDHPLNSALMTELLGDLGLKVDVAANGGEAVAMAARTSYDLILMDVQMPGMNGLEATRAIRLLPGCSKVPIIATTGNVFEDDRAVCLAAGMNDCLVKPTPPDSLYAALLQWLPKSAQPPAE